MDEAPTDTTPAVLTSARVRETMLACRYQPGEDTSAAVMVEGIMAKFSFHPQRLQEHAPQIKEMLHELPKGFQQEPGGGWSFVYACMDRHGNQWTGDQSIMDQLFVLGVAIGAVESQLPRELWEALPGGMPYYVVKSDG